MNPRTAGSSVRGYRYGAATPTPGRCSMRRPGSVMAMTFVFMSIAAAHAAADSLDSLTPLFADVLRAADYGFSEHESAAFIVEDDDGSPGCVWWPGGRAYRRHSFRGAVPLRATGVVHTHPGELRAPSSDDIKEAQRTGLTFFIITRDSIWKVEPDGTSSPLVRKKPWWKSMRRDARPCKTAARYITEGLVRGTPREWRQQPHSTARLQTNA